MSYSYTVNIYEICLKSYSFPLCIKITLSEITMNLHLRWKLCKLFAEAVSDESFSVRVKNKYSLRDTSSMQQNLSIKTNKNGTKSCYMQLNEKRSFRVGGIMFLTDVKSKLLPILLKIVGEVNICNKTNVKSTNFTTLF